MSYIERSYIETIRYLLGRFPCVALIGARQVGKSTLMQHFFESSEIFDMEIDRVFDEVERDPEFFLTENTPPIAIDEAQLSVSLFSHLRVFIDQHRDQAGQYLITGSSSPELLANISESLAGRIAIVEIGTLLFEEAMQIKPSQFYGILENGVIEDFKLLDNRISYQSLLNLCQQGGYPEPSIKSSDEKFHSIWIDNYLRTYIDRDIRRLFPKLSTTTYKRFIRMLSASSGNIINASNFSRSLDVSVPTCKKYFDIAEGTFFWRHLPSYHKNVGKRVTKMPKGYLRDSGLICNFLGIRDVAQLREHPNFGNIWESFIIEQIIKGLQVNLTIFNYYYYRTHNQAEIDLIIEIGSRLIPIEIKTGLKINHRNLVHLKSFIEEHNCPFGIIINNANNIKKLDHKIIQIPAGCL